MARSWKAAAVLVMIAVAAGLLFLGPELLPEPRPADAAARPSRQVPVLVAPVAFGHERTELAAVGTSRARRSVTLYPSAAGEVVAVHFGPGEHVEAGEVLLELDRREEELALQLARVRLAEAGRVIERYRGITGSGAISTATLDEARTAHELAQLEVQRAEVALLDRTVRAPLTGHVGISDVEPGDRIGPDMAITTLDDRDVLLVDFEIPELFLERLRVGDVVAVETWAGDESIEGRVAAIGTRIDPRRRTFVARARVDNRDDRLRPGMSFRVHLDLEGRRYAAVPEVALQWGDEGAYVWRYADGRVQRVPVTIVQRGSGRILVDGALDAGAQIVTEGVQSVREGQAIEVLDVQRAAAGEA